jgi:hypothetical protein
MTQEPYREKILTMELLREFPNAGLFHYYDDQIIDHVEGMAVYPEIRIGSESTRKVTNDSR